MSDKKFIYNTLMTIRNYEQQEHLKEAIKEIENFCCDYYHIKKGYKDEYGIWIENPEYTLLKIWISEKTGWERISKDLFQRSISYKAYVRFDKEEEVML